MNKVKVKSVRKIEKVDKVYDITMQSNPHTFYANDILVHNSCYFRIMEAENLEQAQKIGAEVVEAVDKGSIPMLVTKIFNGFDGVMRSDFEAIARSTLSYGKKKQYAFLKGWEDGEVLPKPKLGITGLSIKRSDSPKQLSSEMKPFFTEIMKGLSHKEIKEKMDKINIDYESLNTYDLAAKRSANNLSKYYRAFVYEIVNKVRPFNIEKLEEAVAEEYGDTKVKISDEIYDKFLRKGEGSYYLEGKELVEDPDGELQVSIKNKMVIPFHIKSTILYNYLLEEKGLDNQFNKIIDGEKIKIFYIKPVKINIKHSDQDGKEHSFIMEFDSIAFPSSSKKIPDFIKDDFKADKKRMLETYFYKKMKTIFDVIDFDAEKLENEAADLLF